MAAEAQRGDGDFDDDDPDDDESPVMAVLSTIDRIHDLPELFARVKWCFCPSWTLVGRRHFLVLEVAFSSTPAGPSVLN